MSALDPVMAVAIAAVVSFSKCLMCRDLAIW
jgi:hypothetical protein